MAGPGAPAEVREALRKAMGLDLPMWQRFFQWLGDAARLDFGDSMQYRVQAMDIIGPKIWNTAILAFSAFVFSLIVGVITGIISGTRPNSLVDRVITAMSVSLASVPGYWLGLMLAFIFAVELGWLPAGGMRDARGDGGFVDLLHHLVLPTITAAAVPTAIISRLVRSSLIEIMAQDYIRTARAKGLRERTVVNVHAMRNAFPTTVNIIALQLGYLLTGDLFAEIVFSWPGVGLQLYQSIGARDIPMIQAITLLTAVLFVAINLISDILQSASDPRLKYG
jgi:peptide/nickel transport system permease protein